MFTSSLTIALIKMTLHEVNLSLGQSFSLMIISQLILVPLNFRLEKEEEEQWNVSDELFRAHMTLSC